MTSETDIIKTLREKIKQQAFQLTAQDAALREKNLALDAMHWVWCDGGCYGGTHRWSEKTLTAEIIAKAEQSIARMRRWFINAAGKKMPTGVDRHPAWDKAKNEIDNANKFVRIDHILDLLDHYWHQHPDLRLGQIITEMSPPHNATFQDDLGEYISSVPTHPVNVSDEIIEEQLLCGLLMEKL